MQSQAKQKPATPGRLTRGLSVETLCIEGLEEVCAAKTLLLKTVGDDQESILLIIMPRRETIELPVLAERFQVAALQDCDDTELDRLATVSNGTLSIPVFIDARLLCARRIQIAGNGTGAIELTPQELQRIMGATILPLV